MVGGGDADNVVAHYLPRISQSGTALAGFERRFFAGDKQEQAFNAAPIGLILHEDPFILCVIVLRRPNVKRATLMTAYPMPREGISRSVVIRDVEEVCFGVEGWIHAETQSEVPLSFFATDYFLHSERYVKGATVDVSLSGLAYLMQAARPREVTIDDPERIRAFGMDPSSISPCSRAIMNCVAKFPTSMRTLPAACASWAIWPTSIGHLETEPAGSPASHSSISVTETKSSICHLPPSHAHV